MTHPIQTNVIITTATFNASNPDVPDTAYGKDVPVKIQSYGFEGKPEHVTVKIGTQEFPISQLRFILDSVSRHNTAVKAWNDSLRKDIPERLGDTSTVVEDSHNVKGDCTGMKNGEGIFKHPTH